MKTANIVKALQNVRKLLGDAQPQNVPPTGLFIGGKFVKSLSGKTFEVINPSTG
jgi:hypothetical protein